PSISETLRLAENYEKSGADLLRIRYPRNESTIMQYFKEVLKFSPLPVLLMHQGEPLNFGVAPKPVASPEVLGEIASMYNVFGYVTEHDMRFESTVRKYVPSDKRFWICNGSMILLGTLIGCNGTTTAFSNIWPDAMKELLKLGIDGKYNEAKQLQYQVKEIDNLMLPFLATGIKYCLKEMGYKGMVPRKPSKTLPEEIQLKIKDKLIEANLI
ncbi:MAG: dihydrodipicolinate synthase family protein, partial [Chloroflexota bacterium]|nr:dihydrodipicolinate synthase family protein [Chloroflexota bacterium]